MFSQNLIAGLIGTLAWLFAAVSAAADQGDPSDPNAPVAPTRYHSVLSGYQNTPIPGVPGNWRELNDRMEQIGGPAGQFRQRDEPIRKKRKP